MAHLCAWPDAARTPRKRARHVRSCQPRRRRRACLPSRKLRRHRVGPKSGRPPLPNGSSGESGHRSTQQQYPHHRPIPIGEPSPFRGFDFIARLPSAVPRNRSPQDLRRPGECLCARSHSRSIRFSKKSRRRPPDLRTLHGSRALRPGCRLLCVRPGKNRQAGRLFHQCQRGFGLRTHPREPVSRNVVSTGQASTASLSSSRAQTMGNSPLISCPPWPVTCWQPSTIGSSNRFPALRRLQERTLEAVEAAVHWVDNLNALPVFDGIHFSNELVDAFPFHLIRCNGNRWEELCVSAREDRLVFELPPCTCARRSDRTAPARAAGTLASFAPQPCHWIQALAGRLNRRIRPDHRLRVPARAAACSSPNERHVFLLSGASPRLAPSRRPWRKGHLRACGLHCARRICTRSRISDRRLCRSAPLSRRRIARPSQ